MLAFINSNTQNELSTLYNKLVARENANNSRQNINLLMFQNKAAICDSRFVIHKAYPCQQIFST